MNKPNILIIDCYSYIYRAYYSYPNFITKKKRLPVGSLYGFLKMIIKLLNFIKSDYIFFVFDSKSDNFRHKLYPNYKSNRKIMPLDLYLQIKPIKKIIKYLGFKNIFIYGIEADDIIGTISYWIDNNYQNKFNIIISTIDKDIFQLANKNIFIHNILNNKILNFKDICIKFGLNKPKLIIEYLSLLGDNTDNIKGVPFIGKISSKIICNYFGSIKNLLNNKKNIKIITKLKNRINIYKSIKLNIKLIKLNYQLIKIKQFKKIINKNFLNNYKISLPNLKKIIFFLSYYELNYFKKKIKYLLNINNLYRNINKFN